MFRSAIRSMARAAPRARVAARPARSMSTTSASGAARAGVPQLLALGGVVGTTLSLWAMTDSMRYDLSAITGGGSAKDPSGVWVEIKKDIVEVIDDNACGPFLVRLAWHTSGTYDAKTQTGGSNGGTIRFSPEKDHGANAGLNEAMGMLEPIKAKYPDVSYGDLYTYAGAVAIEALGGPKIPWKAGRTDAPSGDACTPDGRLPDADKGPEHLRAIFGRMGFNDQEIVALSGAHVLGFCHTDRSGFDGPWSRDPNAFSNDYFKLLLDETWQLRKWGGPPQFQNASDKTLMMLPTDMVLLVDTSFRTHVDKYAADKEAFFGDFAKAFAKLLELGVPRS